MKVSSILFFQHEHKIDVPRLVVIFPQADAFPLLIVRCRGNLVFDSTYIHTLIDEECYLLGCETSGSGLILNHQEEPHSE